MITMLLMPLERVHCGPGVGMPLHMQAQFMRHCLWQNSDGLGEPLTMRGRSSMIMSALCVPGRQQLQRFRFRMFFRRVYEPDTFTPIGRGQRVGFCR